MGLINAYMDHRRTLIRKVGGGNLVLKDIMSQKKRMKALAQYIVAMMRRFCLIKIPATADQYQSHLFTSFSDAPLSKLAQAQHAIKTSSFFHL